jgi:hypothetical protein
MTRSALVTPLTAEVVSAMAATLPIVRST